MTRILSPAVPGRSQNRKTATPEPCPATTAGLLRRGVAPHIAVASAQAGALGQAARKRRILTAAELYERARDLPPLWPDHLDADLLTVDPAIGVDWTRHILLRLGRMLKFHRTNPSGRASMATNIAIAMAAEAAILRRQQRSRHAQPRFQ